MLVMRVTRFALAAAIAALVGGQVLAAEPTAADIEFEPPVRLKAGEKFIDSGEFTGHSGPLVADLDDDGKPDLLVGNFSGNIQVFMNRGSRQQPEYVAQGLLKAEGKDVEIHNW